MADIFCNDCNRFTEVVFDHTSGDTVCSECGLVLESHSIDETSEWRSFADSADDTDPNRVGGPTNPLLSDIALTTVISTVNAGSNRDHHLPKNSSNSIDKKSTRLLSAFRTISSMADRLSLVPIIKDRANEIYKKLIDNNNGQKSYRGKHSDAMLAACLFVACQQENLPRTLKEICSVVANGITKRDIGRAKSFIMQHLDDHTMNTTSIDINSNNDNKRMIRAADFVKRFCSNIGNMDHRAMKAAFEAVQTSEEEIDVRRSPLSLAAAVIYIVSQLSEESKRPALRDIAVATGVAEGTIKSAYKDLRPHLGKIVPTWFASGDDLKMMVCSL